MSLAATVLLLMYAETMSAVSSMKGLEVGLSAITPASDCGCNSLHFRPMQRKISSPPDIGPSPLGAGLKRVFTAKIHNFYRHNLQDKVVRGRNFRILRRNSVWGGPPLQFEPDSRAGKPWLGCVPRQPIRCCRDSPAVRRASQIARSLAAVPPRSTRRYRACRPCR